MAITRVHDKSASCQVIDFAARTGRTCHRLPAIVSEAKPNDDHKKTARLLDSLDPGDLTFMGPNMLIHLRAIYRLAKNCDPALGQVVKIAVAIYANVRRGHVIDIHIPAD